MWSRRCPPIPKATSALAQSISPWPLSSPGYFRDLQGRLKRFVESGQLGPFKNGYWGSKAYRLPPEANLMAVAHYLEALDFQKEIVKIHTIFGGKNPHPNWLVGGVPCPINVDGDRRRRRDQHGALNYITEIIDRSIEFTDQVYLPDVAAIGSFYKDWLYGGGLSSKSVLAYGDVPEHANDYSAPPTCCCRRARSSTAISQRFIPVNHARSRGDPGVRRPIAGTNIPTRPRACIPGTASPTRITNSAPTPRARKTNIESLDEGGKYSWIKAPRWKGNAMEVGPLARWIVGYAQNKPEFKEPVDKLLKDLGLPLTALFSTLGPHGGARRWNASGRPTRCGISRTS